jgi:hypothetical protein
MEDFPEMQAVNRLRKMGGKLVRHSVLETVKSSGHEFPIVGFEIGSMDPASPCIGLFGGVHGLERVGSQVVLNYLNSLIRQLAWDQDLRNFLSRARIVSIPVINPGGMYASKRCNPNGIDLMRNAPIDADAGLETFLVSGHRISKLLPWYRGEIDGPIEAEAAAVIEFCKKSFFAARAAIAVDFHSGFGMKDRLWYPFATTKRMFPNQDGVRKLTKLLNRSLPHHIYQIERQTDAYAVSGDLWDYIYLQHREAQAGESTTFIPWTLEMGSWLWIKKNPRQILSPLGFFNPIKSHRESRIMRRHILLIDFFRRAVANFGAWA